MLPEFDRENHRPPGTQLTLLEQQMTLFELLEIAGTPLQ
jgi:hypothetical protein